MRKRWAGAVIGVLAAIGSRSWACSCDTPTVLEDLASSDAVFTGTAIRVEHRRVTVAKNWFSSSVHVTFRVKESWKGVERSIVTIVTGEGGGDCGYEFEKDCEYTVFAASHGDSTLRTGICSQTARASARLRDELGPPVREFTTFEGLAELRRAVRGARKTSVYEAVAIPGDCPMFRCDSTRITALRGYWFHAEKQRLRGKDARKAAQIFDNLTFAPLGGQKALSFNVHPEFCLEWLVDDETHRALVFLEGWQIEYVGPHVMATVDLTGANRVALEDLLLSIQSRDPCYWDRPPREIPDLAHPALEYPRRP